MYDRLNASVFSGSGPFRSGEFEIILSIITACYQRMISDGLRVPNDENGIRDMLYLNYLGKDEIKRELGMLNYRFDRESAEDYSDGRTDIRVLSQESFLRQEAYYTLECKRLDNVNIKGSTGLNAEYIKNGIIRFTSKHYSTYYRVNGMIGFIVKPLDIHANTDCINTLLETEFQEANTSKHITKANFIDGFEYHYVSSHSDIDNKPLVIYHLMFDFSGSINIME